MDLEFENFCRTSYTWKTLRFKNNLFLWTLAVLILCCPFQSSFYILPKREGILIIFDYRWQLTEPSILSPQVKQKAMKIFKWPCLLTSHIPWVINSDDSIIMMMMNCFYGMVDRRKAFSLISSRDHCQRSSPSQISDTPRAGFEPAQNLSSGLVEWSCEVAIITTPWHHNIRL